MHDNNSIDVRCRALWTEILTALQDRIASVNRYVPDKRSHIVFEQTAEETLRLHQVSSERSVTAQLDLKNHAIHLREYRDRAMEQPTALKEMPLSMLADGELYVTDGNELKGNAMEAAKALLDALLATKSEAKASA